MSVDIDRQRNFELVQGAYKLLKVTATDDDGPLNLIGALLTWTLSKKRRSSTTLATKAIGTGIVVTDASHGLFEITLTATDTADIAGQYYHECFVTDNAGRTDRLFWGYVSVARRH